MEPERRSTTLAAAKPKAAALRGSFDAPGALGELPYVALTESTDTYALGASLDGTITYCGPRARALFGVDGRQLLGRHLAELFSSDHAEQFRQAIVEVGQRRRVRPIECRFRAREGQDVELSVALYPSADPSGNLSGLAIEVRDTTEQRWMAQTLDDTLDALRSALDEAQESEERTRRFLADAAHQLRTPMAGIRASAEMLLAGPGEDHRQQLMTVLIRETERASGLMASLLSMARLEQGVELESKPCDLQLLCEYEAERARPMAPHLRIGVSVATDVVPVMGDERALREMLANIMDNARRHASSEITLEVARTETESVIRIANDGPKLDPSKAESVFERFVSLDGKGGSGLGLPIARAVARAHGGDLVYSEGAFVITLPIDRCEQQSPDGKTRLRY